MTNNGCRFCGSPLNCVFVNLGMTPLANSFIKQKDLNMMEPFYPLKVMVCDSCFLAQLGEHKAPKQIFDNYAYYSSYSDTWLKHCQQYTEGMIEKLRLGADSLVMEIASNDGYLLQYFHQKGIPCFGIEPAANVAKKAIEKGIETRVKYFGSQIASELTGEGKHPDLIIGNNVLAHVPNLNDFVKGMKTVLKPNGVITMEFPHLMRLMGQNQFDTIYHEHFSYFSLLTVNKIFRKHDLKIFDVEELSTHGGSLRIFVAHIEDKEKKVLDSVKNLEARELEAGMDHVETYSAFANKIYQAKLKALQFLIKVKNEGKTIVGYGAPAKGNTLLNYLGIGTDIVEYTVDLSPHKQGLYLPGTHIPIYHPDKIKETKPDYIFILPWNISDEIMEQMAVIREWGGRFVTAIPEIRVV